MIDCPDCLAVGLALAAGLLAAAYLLWRGR